MFCPTVISMNLTNKIKDINFRTDQKFDGILDEFIKNTERNHIDDSIPNQMRVRISKGVLAFAFILLTYNIVKISLLKPSGFVVDIYSVMPIIFIPSLILCFSIASFSIFNTNSQTRVGSIFLLITILFTILIIPYAFGYYSMGRADDMSYLGEYLHISKTGYFSDWDIYPAGLIFGAFLTIITGIETNIISFIIPTFFTASFIIGFFIFGRKIFKNKNYENILLISLFILYLGMYNFLNTPHALFFAFLPLYLFIILKYIELGTLPYAIAAIILSLLIPLTHPFVFFFVVMFQLLLLLFTPFIKNIVIGDIRRLRNLVLIQITTFSAWFLYSTILLDSFERAINAFLLKLTEPVLSETTNKMARIGLDPLSFINFVLIYYGRYIIPTVVIISFLTLYYLKYRKVNDYNRPIKFLVITYTITFFIEIILFLNPIISHQPDRMTNLLFLVYFQVPLFSISSIVFINFKGTSLRRITVRKTIVISIVIVTFGLSLVGAFNSPMVYATNSALTVNEATGMKWVYELREGQNISAPLSQLDRFHNLFDDGMRDNHIHIPDHFGYDVKNATFYNSVDGYSGSLYVVIMKIDYTLYEEVPGYKNVGRYTYNDYYQFNCDNSINRIYSGNDINIFYTFR
jgi:hypothetical protein